MKNLMSLIITATLFLLVSCSKETVELPKPDTNLETASLKADLTTDNDDFLAQPSTEAEAEHASITLRIQVSEVANSEVADEYLVTFSGNYDFTGAVLENFQNLKFTDASGTESTLNFEVNNALGSNGTLEVDFAMGGNDLTGLTLAVSQEIIIEDYIVN